MAFNLKPTTGEFTPYLKFNGKAGRWYTKNESGDEVEVTNMTAVFDLQQIKTGWLLFSEGQAPEYVFDQGADPGPRPSDKHKRGFVVQVFSEKNLGGAREFSSSSNGAIAAMQALYQAYEAAPEATAGKLPVVQCKSVLPVKNKFGTNYQPVLEIVAWVDRPAGLPLASPPAMAAAAPATSATSPVPPPRAAAPATASAGVEF